MTMELFFQVETPGTSGAVSVASFHCNVICRQADSYWQGLPILLFKDTFCPLPRDKWTNILVQTQDA